MNRIIAVMFTSIMLSGCVTSAPSQEVLAKADYGSSITQQDAENIAKNFLKTHLKDPDSANIEWGSIEKGWLRESRIAGFQLRFGHILRANINAKNSYGGYNGYKPYQFLFKNGKIICVYAETETSDGAMWKVY